MSNTMKKITRKSLLYETKVEYGDYCLNHVLGCAHGCKFPCYAFNNAKRFGRVKSYEEWINPALVENALEILDKEIPKLKDKISSVQLCFTTDPFMYKYDEVGELSTKVIHRLNEDNIKCNILTKGILPIELKDLSKENEYGITLVSLDEVFRSQYEPNTSRYEERINNLYNLSKAGCKTWISIEPYPTPNIVEQNLEEILNAISFTDKIIFGRLNYNPLVRKYPNYKEYYNGLASQVIKFCNENNIAYHIKEGTVTTDEDNK